MRQTIPIKNEKGAALLLTLFIIVFVSIVGAGLLNTTLYGKKTNVTALSEQQEFYKLEGAIDLFISEMNHYQDSSENEVLKYKDGNGNLHPITENGEEIPIVKKGPFFYLANNTNPRVQNYNIDGELIEVLILNESLTGDVYNITLTAKQIANSKLQRSIDLKINRGTGPTIYEGVEVPAPIPPFTGSAVQATKKLDLNPNLRGNPAFTMIGTTFAEILSFYQLQPSLATGNLNSAYKFDSTKNKHHFNSISIGNHDTITIPEGHLVYIQQFHSTGGTLVINGFLIINDLKVTGNGKFNLVGALIGQDVEFGSNAITIDARAGVNPETGEGGGYKPPRPTITESDYTVNSNIDMIIDMRTER
ncbi:hypothetical protein [Alkalihalobacterium elongatum]|uniref:hypothetical protein n=1 Tax=Alkalihalobacterium elongatum TaxID=2675466 RepID=UPI001C1FEBDF|nr:hypothetical protein [Alkalihalobacterium elongatum]